MIRLYLIHPEVGVMIMNRTNCLLHSTNVTNFHSDTTITYCHKNSWRRHKDEYITCVTAGGEMNSNQNHTTASYSKHSIFYRSLRVVSWRHVSVWKDSLVSSSCNSKKTKIKLPEENSPEPGPCILLLLWLEVEWEAIINLLCSKA